VALVGLLVYFFHDRLHWIGRLPGDFRVKKPGFRLYFPFTTLLLLSLLLTLVVNLVKKFL
jgi:hypothetical protein